MSILDNFNEFQTRCLFISEQYRTYAAMLRRTSDTDLRHVAELLTLAAEHNDALLRLHEEIEIELFLKPKPGVRLEH